MNQTTNRPLEEQRRCPLIADAIAICILAGGLAAFAQAHPQSVQRAGVLIVHEGTDMALTVSPDHKTIMIDLQGMLYTLAASGGRRSRSPRPCLKPRIRAGRPKAIWWRSSPTPEAPFTSGR